MKIATPQKTAPPWHGSARRLDPPPLAHCETRPDGSRLSAADRAPQTSNCIESEKLMTMMSGVITLRNMLSRKIEPAQRPQCQQNGDQGRASGHHHEREAPEEYDGNQATRRKAKTHCRECGRAQRHCGFQAASPARQRVAPAPGDCPEYHAWSCGFRRPLRRVPASARWPDQAPQRPAPAARPRTTACPG